ncbi:hypothetical protein [Arthrobacter castelli]|uniref:hypothetical protein n=1 Tax=Arthrobacter castelli TaxID=271431 RepID=UPI00047CCD30|nr:hypothetical protein [Arthrobacter castelli]
MAGTKSSRKWLDDLALKLRQRNVSGRDTGDAVAHVESYCADSGESPAQAFGDPVVYAATLPLPRRRPWSTRQKLVGLVPVTLQVLGLLVLLPGLFSLTDGAVVNLSAYFLLLAIMTAGCLILAGVHLDKLARQPLLAVVVLLPFTGIVLALTLLEQGTNVPSITLPAVATMLIGFSMLLAGSILGQLRGNEQDPVVKPVGSNHAATLRGQLVTLIINWALPAGAVLFSAGWLAFT